MENKIYTVRICDRGHDFHLDCPSLPCDLYDKLKATLAEYARERQKNIV